MSFILGLIAKAVDFISGSTDRHLGNLPVANERAKVPQDRASICGKDFDEDYSAAMRLLRDRIDRKFPDGHYAKLRSGMSTPHDFGEDRAQAVDTMSTAIATALRDGATVKQAAEAGAASIGI